MCRLDETWHVPCGHWGPRRNVSPCAVGHNRQKGCLHSTIEGCSRVYTLCPSCEYRVKREGKTPTSDISHTSRKSQGQEQVRNSQPGMTVHGLCGKEGRKWLRHRLRRWHDRKLTPGEQFEKNRSQEGKGKKMVPNASETMSSEPTGMISPKLSEMAEQLPE